MATRTLLTLEEFERLPEDGMRHELTEGELVSVTHPKFRHGWIAQNINYELSRFVADTRLGKVFSEVAYLLSEDPPTLRVPDVSFVRANRLRGVSLDDYFRGAPDLAVEVVSPSDSAEDLESKVSQYLAAGSHEVWVVYPKPRTIHVSPAGGKTVVLSADQILDAPDLFPGWSIEVGKLLAGPGQD